MPDGLYDLLRLLRDKWRNDYREKDLTDEINRLCDPMPLDQLKAIGVELSRLIAEWNRRLIENFNLDIPPERVLCGFNAPADVTYQFGNNNDEFARFVSWVANRHASTEKQAIREALSRARQKPLLLKRVDNVIEMLAAMFQAMMHPGEEWKPVMGRELWGPVQEYVYSRQGDKMVAFRMGGASGNMSYVLSQLGLDTTMHWPYHPPEISGDSPPDLKRLLVAGDQVQVVRADRSRPDPVRRSFVFDFAQGLSPTGTKIVAAANSRVIFLTSAYRSDQTKPWNRLVVQGAVSAELQDNAKEALGNDGWPFFPIFGSFRVSGDTLTVEIASDKAMEEIAERFDYFMIAGIQAIGDALHKNMSRVDNETIEPTARTIVKHALIRQLDILAKKRIVVHWETGGIKSPQLLDDLADIARGRIKSAAMNNTELDEITSGTAFRNTRYSLSLPPQFEILTRFDRACHLAHQLDLDELYIHGNDVDLIVRRHTTPGALRQEVGVTLFAKGVVLLTLLKRSVPDWVNLINTRIDIQPVLKVDGFCRLLELAKGLAMRRFPKQQELESKLFVDIARNGYFHDRNPGAYSAMVVPVMWPELNVPFSTAGAGDTTSSVVALYSGK